MLLLALGSLGAARAEELPEPLARVDQGLLRYSSAGVKSWTATLRWVSSYEYECEDQTRLDMKGLEFDLTWRDGTWTLSLRNPPGALPAAEVQVLQNVVTNLLLGAFWDPFEDLRGMRSVGATLECGADGRSVVARVGPDGPPFRLEVSEDSTELREETSYGEGTPPRVVTRTLQWQEDRCVVIGTDQPSGGAAFAGVQQTLTWQVVSGVAFPDHIAVTETNDVAHTEKTMEIELSGVVVEMK